VTLDLHPVPAPDPDAQLAARTAEIAARITADAGRELRYALASQTLIACDRCGQWSGMECRTSGGWQLIGVHAARRDATATMSPDERITAYAREKARQALAREAWETRQADPEYIAQRDAQRAAVTAAFDELRERQWAEERERQVRCHDPYLHRDDCRCRDPEWTPTAPPTPRLVGVAPVADLAVERARRSR
jgi:hypothetical protein